MFTDKVVVITGGAQGIGKCIADQFRENGAKVYIIDKAPGEHYVGDIADKAVLEAFADKVLSENGQVDILVNNALPLMRGIDSCTYEQFSYAMAVGVTAPFYLAPFYRRRQHHQYLFLPGQNESTSNRKLHGSQRRHCRADPCVGRKSWAKSSGQQHFPRLDRHSLHRLRRPGCCPAACRTGRQPYGYCQCRAVSVFGQGWLYHRRKYMYRRWTDKINDLPW